ncbi:hypothetical protein [Proteiniborus sp. MB09-C3]|uniref:DUF7768 domain-containing protein n=1 Tax=Proteiniborus sp. MB09-C3 TaxID=3050072 RepID=UPI002555B441|nr:hypothetical protein [Proteiniborus sp. MB09-C3]WIV11124.1 hypothetical protein QO263_13325 [Proteiniborus sp. MB09-C3]
MKLIYISFPLDDRKISKEQIDKYCKYVIDKRFLPITSKCIVEQLEKIYDNKHEILDKRLELVKRCDEVWTFQEEVRYNMVDEVKIAKISNIPVRYIELKREISKYGNLYQYKKRLQEVNNLLYSRDIDIGYSILTDCLEWEIEIDKGLSRIQKKYLISRVKSDPLTFYDLSNGYRYVWNLNNNLRNRSLYILTMRYIQYLKWGNRKINLMKKMFYFIKRDNSILGHTKEWIIKKLYYEIIKQAEIENHSKSHILGQIYKFEDIHDLVEMFLEE